MPRPPKLDLSILPKADFSCDAPSSGRDETTQEFHAAYSLGAALGSGTTAVVKRAVRQGDGQHVAVKCIFSREEEVQHFAQQEYDILCSVQHASIVRMEAFYSSGPHTWMVMELCEDGTLASFEARHGPLGEAHACPLMRQLLEATSHLHQKRVVHRDLKPDNLLLQGQGAVLKVTDFNSAKVIGNSLESSAMLTHRGTRAYAAPELVLGHHWNERVDIWSAGLCFYFMLEGSKPFGCDDRSSKEAFSAGRLPELSWRRSSPSVELQDFIHECLAVDMLNRPPAMKLLVNPLMMRPTQEPNGFSLGLALSSFMNAIASELCCSWKRATIGEAPAKPKTCPSSPDMLVQRYNMVLCQSKTRTLSMPHFTGDGGTKSSGLPGTEQDVSAPPSF